MGLSYLIDGTGPVKVRDLTLTRANLVEELLNKPYIELEPEEQDELFQDAAAAVFDASTSKLASPVDFVEGMSRAAREGRFLVAPFDDQDNEVLTDTRVIGALAGDDGSTPHVDIGLNDATGSKMSYYLRYSAEIESRSCAQDTQELTGTMTMRQAIAPDEAAKLPESVTGGGNYGTEPGSQLVFVRLYGPYGGTLDEIKVIGRSVDDEFVETLNGRPVASLAIVLENRDDVVINWSMTTAKGQTGDAQVALTPSVVPGKNTQSVPSACPRG